MPLYDYKCPVCGHVCEHKRPFEIRDEPLNCDNCNGAYMVRQMAAPLGRIAGRVVQGGGADRFTADMLGIPLKELPAGLRQDKGKATSGS